MVMPAVAQPAKARSSADVDLPTRLKEVERDAKLSEDILKIGRKAAAVCANCHGETGNSPKSDTPNLAGQNPAYLVEQLRKFAEGQRRNEFMEGMIKAMKSDEKIGIVLFYSSQKVTHKPASNPALAAKGKEYFNKICFRCHGEDGRGNEQFARLAGQQADYMRLALQRYRAGTGIRMDPLMAASTKLMSDADIAAVVAYAGSMQ
ncbi:MAG: c-type cytochrome [Pseudomonadota bacterium]